MSTRPSLLLGMEFVKGVLPFEFVSPAISDEPALQEWGKGTQTSPRSLSEPRTLLAALHALTNFLPNSVERVLISSFLQWGN